MLTQGTQVARRILVLKTIFNNTIWFQTEKIVKFIKLGTRINQKIILLFCKLFIFDIFKG